MCDRSLSPKDPGWLWGPLSNWPNFMGGSLRFHLKLKNPMPCKEEAKQINQAAGNNFCWSVPKIPRTTKDNGRLSTIYFIRFFFQDPKRVVGFGKDLNHQRRITATTWWVFSFVKVPTKVQLTIFFERDQWWSFSKDSMDLCQVPFLKDPTQIQGGGNSKIFYFHPYLGKFKWVETTN